MGNYQLTAIIELLNPDNTISAHRMLAHSIGMTETIIYSSLISKQTYYSRNGMLFEDGWFYSTIYDLQESTTFGAKAQKTAIKHLISHGLIECEYKGMPAKRYFRIINDTDKIMKLIDDGLKISQRIVTEAKEHNVEKRGCKAETSSEIVTDDVSASSYPSDITSSYPKAGTCDSPSHGKTIQSI